MLKRSPRRTLGAFINESNVGKLLRASDGRLLTTPKFQSAAALER